MAALGWHTLLRPYQKLRILNLLNPNLDPQNTGYNSLQSLVAVGSGNLFGKGFMQGTQAQLKFLPERHTDFVFSVFAEEHGFWGAALVFAAFGVLTYIALEIARTAKDTFTGLLAVGIAALIFLEFTINVAMVLGVFPVVGLPLPFFSYGSSLLLTVCVALGLLVSINRATNGHSAT
jgi:rod shape determining protein RodA